MITWQPEIFSEGDDDSKMPFKIFGNMTGNIDSTSIAWVSGISLNRSLNVCIMAKPIFTDPANPPTTKQWQELTTKQPLSREQRDSRIL